MQLIENINAVGLVDRLAAYIKEKNAVFIVANGICVNRAYKDFSPDELSCALENLGACDAFLVNQSNQTLSSPILAVNITPGTCTAFLAYLLDLVPQAENGQASPFYSKLMGAVATQFFAGTSRADRIWVPFALEDTVGRGAAIESDDRGCFLVKA